MANRILYSFFLILVLVAICRTQREPRCSKYDFEEKVLEKLIRMEHSNELIMEEFRQISTSVKEDIETMKGKLTEIQRQAKEEQARLKAFVEGNLFAFLPRTRNSKVFHRKGRHKFCVLWQ